MYLIKSVTFNFARRLVLISRIIIGSFKDIIRIVLYPPSLALRLITKPFKRHKFKHYKPSQDRRHDDGFTVVDEHKHDNYQSQIDGFHRKINELLLNDEAYNKQFNRLDKEVKEQGSWILKSGKNRLNALEDKVNNMQYYHIDNDIATKIETLKAKIDKLLSENSELIFKPLTKEEERLQDIELEANWHDDVDSHYEEMAKKEYPSEPDFNSEQKAMAKQMAEVAKRDEEDV